MTVLCTTIICRMVADSAHRCRRGIWSRPWPSPVWSLAGDSQGVAAGVVLFRRPCCLGASLLATRQWMLEIYVPLLGLTGFALGLAGRYRVLKPDGRRPRAGAAGSTSLSW